MNLRNQRQTVIAGFRDRLCVRDRTRIEESPPCLRFGRNRLESDPRISEGLASPIHDTLVGAAAKRSEEPMRRMHERFRHNEQWLTRCYERLRNDRPTTEEFPEQ